MQDKQVERNNGNRDPDLMNILSITYDFRKILSLMQFDEYIKKMEKILRRQRIKKYLFYFQYLWQNGEKQLMQLSISQNDFVDFRNQIKFKSQYLIDQMNLTNLLQLDKIKTEIFLIICQLSHKLQRNRIQQSFNLFNLQNYIAIEGQLGFEHSVLLLAYLIFFPNLTDDPEDFETLVFKLIEQKDLEQFQISQSNIKIKKQNEENQKKMIHQQNPNEKIQKLQNNCNNFNKLQENNDSFNKIQIL